MGMVWWKVRADDADTPEGRYILGRRTAKDWANYGRWVTLRGYLTGCPSAAIDHRDKRAMDALGCELGLSKKQLAEFVSLLLDAGAINQEEYEDGFIVCDDVSRQWAKYQNRSAVNTVNGGKRASG